MARKLRNDKEPALNMAPLGNTDVVHSDTDLSEKPEKGIVNSYPPADHGKHCWLYLAAGFMIDAVVWGFPNTFGVFQEYYSTNEPFAGSPMIPIIGTCTLGVMYLDVPIVMGLQKIYPSFGRWSPFIGLCLMSISLGVSSYSQTTTQLLVSQGIFFALGSSIIYCPVILYFDDWFVKRRGTAFGVMLSGTGLAGSILPLIFEHFLHTYGFRTALRIWAVALVVLMAPLLYYVKPRLPPIPASATETFKFKFVMDKTFLLYQASNVFQALGFFLPNIYLPTYARAIGASHFMSAFTLVLINVASTIGCACMGLITDRYHVTICFLVSAIGSTLSTFLIWGLAAKIPVLLLFCVIYGLCAGSYPSAWPGVTKHMLENKTPSQEWRRDSDASEATLTEETESKEASNSTMILGMLSMGRGIGSVISGPLSHALIEGQPWADEAFGGYGTGYGLLIVFTGISAIISGASFLWFRLGWM